MRQRFCLVFTAIAVAFSLRGADADPAKDLIEKLGPLLDLTSRKVEQYNLKAEFDVAGVKGTIEAASIAPHQFWMRLNAGKDIEGTINVSPSEAWIDVPSKNVLFLSSGPLSADAEGIEPLQIINAAASINQSVFAAWSLFQEPKRNALAPLLNLIATVEAQPGNAFNVSLGKKGKGLALAFPDGNGFQANLSMEGGTKDAPTKNSVSLKRVEKLDAPVRANLPADRIIVNVPRDEFERAIQRGALRAMAIEGDDLYAKAPHDTMVEIPGARLDTKTGQRVCYLTGTPAEMGRQHGRLLATDARRVVDSTLYVVGFAYSVAKQKWFLNDIRDAWKRLEPHCDKEYLEELDGIAEGASISKEELRLANVFPELFHCSGFAIAKEATVGGKLFHGRILDYMTQIGLQHVQVDFITRGANRKATVNVGYAGFVGCVTGMNDAQISMGEMGGRGEGNWDGTPMAFLMRRVLEHAGTLDEARQIMSDAKRTCEYYYVVADGKSREALGVAAWPDKIEFLKPGESHKLLPNPVQGCVLLSAGDRYTMLSQRAKDSLGKLDFNGALELMKRPVSMNSCLHAVLFVPEEKVYYAAHASLRGHKAATEGKYLKHDFKAQLTELAEIEKLAKGPKQ